MSRFCLPDLGEGLIEAEIVNWHVSEGDHIVADQPLVSVEMKRAIVELPSPHAGRIGRLCAKPGDVINVGDALVEFDEQQAPDEGTVVGDLPRPSAGVSEFASKPDRPAPTASTARPMISPRVREQANALAVDPGTVTPTGAHGEITVEDVRNAARAACTRA